MRAKDVMTSNPLTISPRESLGSALSLMERRQVRRLPVVNNGKLVGIITKNDIYSAVRVRTDRNLSPKLREITVEEIMSRHLITASQEDPIEQCALTMVTNRVSGLPVLDKEKNIVGIITETDIFKVFVNMLGIHEGGTRLDFKTDNPEKLVDLFKKVAVGSLVCYKNRNDREWTVIARVGKKKR